MGKKQGAKRVSHNSGEIVGGVVKDHGRYVVAGQIRCECGWMSTLQIDPEDATAEWHKHEQFEKRLRKSRARAAALRASGDLPTQT